MYDFKGFGSTPRSAIPDLREYSHKSGIVPLGVLPDPLKLCTGSGHDMIQGVPKKTLFYVSQAIEGTRSGQDTIIS